jgi:hypothetical protein
MALEEAAKHYAECEEKVARVSGNRLLREDLTDAEDALCEMALSYAVARGYRK